MAEIIARIFSTVAIFTFGWLLNRRVDMKWYILFMVLFFVYGLVNYICGLIAGEKEGAEG